MSTNVLMPALSPTMEQGKLAKWLKKEGDTVKSGDVIAEIETDKATMEVEAVDEGVLAKILVGDGTENVAVNTPIAVIAGNGDERRAGEKIAPAAKAPQETPAKAPPRPSTPPATSTVKQRAVPLETEYTGKTTTMTVREALRDAMVEEMRRDDTVFLIGEEVAEYQERTRSARACCRSSGRGASSTPRSQSRALPASGSAPAMPACDRSSSS